MQSRAAKPRNAALGRIFTAIVPPLPVIGHPASPVVQCQPWCVIRQPHGDARQPLASLRGVLALDACGPSFRLTRNRFRHALHRLARRHQEPHPQAERTDRNSARYLPSRPCPPTSRLMRTDLSSHRQTFRREGTNRPHRHPVQDAADENHPFSPFSIPSSSCFAKRCADNLQATQKVKLHLAGDLRLQLAKPA